MLRLRIWNILCYFWSVFASIEALFIMQRPANSLQFPNESKVIKSPQNLISTMLALIMKSSLRKTQWRD